MEKLVCTIKLIRVGYSYCNDYCLASCIVLNEVLNVNNFRRYRHPTRLTEIVLFD